MCDCLQSTTHATVWETSSSLDAGVQLETCVHVDEDVEVTMAFLGIDWQLLHQVIRFQKRLAAFILQIRCRDLEADERRWSYLLLLKQFEL
jgi:hypothetical protein